MKFPSCAVAFALTTAAACGPDPSQDAIGAAGQAIKSNSGAGGAAGLLTSTDRSGETVLDACSLPGSTRPELLAYGDIWAADEGASRALPLPFPFSYFGRAQSQFWVTSNGELGFGAAAAGAPFGEVRCPLADPSVPPPIVFAYATDFMSSTICVATTGTTPRRKLVVTWKDAHLYELDGTGNGTSNLMFTTTLEESTNAVDVLIQNVDMASPFFPIDPVIQGGWAAVGLQAGASARSFSCQQPNAGPGSWFHYQP